MLPDAQPEKIAEALFWSMYLLNGQACVGLKRLYVHEDLYADLAGTLVAYARQIKTGDGFESESALGPIRIEPNMIGCDPPWQRLKRAAPEFISGTDSPGHQRLLLSRHTSR